jgi:hypothetical protein
MASRRILPVLVFLSLWAYGSDLTVLPVRDAAPSAVRGRVTGKTGAAPLEGVRISLLDKAPAATTGPDGTYILENVPAGIHQVLFEKDGYLPAVVRVRVADGRDSLANAVLEALHTEITVSASAATRPDTVASSGQILTATEIKALPGILEDISRAVQVVPGVASAGDFRNDLIVRGGAPAENLFMIDWIQVPGLSHFGSQNSGGGGFFGLLNPNLVKSIDFFSGGFPASYGDKLSSVTRLLLREGDRIRFRGDLDLSLFGASGSVEAPLPGRAGSWVLSLRKDYFFAIPKNWTMDFTVVPNFFDIQTKAVVDISRRLSFSLVGLAAEDNIHIEESDRPADQRMVIRMKDHLYLLGGTLTWLLGPSGVLRITLAQANSRFFYSESSHNQERYTTRSDNIETSVRLDAEFSLAPRFQIMTGMSYRAIDAGDHILFRGGYMVIDRMGFRYVKTNMNAGLTSGKWAFYLQASAALLRGLRATAGVRIDRFEYIDQTVAGPRLGLSCDLWKNASAHLSYGFVYQAPETFWLDSYPGNRSLSYLKARQAVFGFESLVGPAVKATAEVFLKDYFNYPVDSANPFQTLANLGGSVIPTFYGSPLVSAGTGFARGVELSAQSAQAGRWTWLVDYSYSIVRYKALDGVLRNGDFDYRHLVNAVVTYRAPRGWNASLKWRLIGGQPYTPFNVVLSEQKNGTYFDMTQINTLRYPAYHRLDLRLEKTWAFKTWSLEAYLDLQNVYNRKNVYYKFWDDGEERTVTYLPLVPFLGLQASF